MLMKEKANEIAKNYNDELKTCKTVEEVHSLIRKFWNDANACDAGVCDLRTKKGYKPINNFFATHDPNKIEYICDSDVWVRCCKIENLYKFVKFEIR